MSLKFISEKARLWHVMTHIEIDQWYLLYSAEHDGTLISGAGLKLYVRYMTREDRATYVRVPVSRDEGLEIGRKIWTTEDVKVRYGGSSGSSLGRGRKS